MEMTDDNLNQLRLKVTQETFLDLGNNEITLNDLKEKKKKKKR